jgi:hypothetical protein
MVAMPIFAGRSTGGEFVKTPGENVKNIERI